MKRKKEPFHITMSMLLDQLYKPLKDVNVGEKIYVTWEIQDPSVIPGLRLGCNMTVISKEHVNAIIDDEDMLLLDLTLECDKGTRTYRIKGDSCCEGNEYIRLHSFSMPSFGMLKPGDKLNFECYGSYDSVNLEITEVKPTRSYVYIKANGDLTTFLSYCEQITETMTAEFEFYFDKEAVMIPRVFGEEVLYITAMKLN